MNPQQSIDSLAVLLTILEVCAIHNITYNEYESNVMIGLMSAPPLYYVNSKLFSSLLLREKRKSKKFRKY
jgi:hypothetical protein